MNSIKTDILLGDNGKEYDLGRVTRKEMYLKTLSKEEALRLFDAGKRVYFIYLFLCPNLILCIYYFGR